MKHYLMCVLMAATVLFATSCKKEDPSKPFKMNTVDLLLSYMGMDVYAAADKMKDDFDLTTAIWGTTPEMSIRSGSNCEEIKAYANAQDEIYLIYYTRNDFAWPQSTLFDIAKRLSSDVNKYFSITHPCTYKEGFVGTKGAVETVSNHADFVSKMESVGTSFTNLQEYWEGRGKEWYVNPGSKMIEIKLSND